VEQAQDRTRGGVNVQDSFFYALRRDAKPVHIYLVSGRRLVGTLRRFDRYALVIEKQGHEILIYKHAIASVSLTGTEGERVASEGA
jgi:host factor-I protein